MTSAKSLPFTDGASGLSEKAEVIGGEPVTERLTEPVKELSEVAWTLVLAGMKAAGAAWTMRSEALTMKSVGGRYTPPLSVSPPASPPHTTICPLFELSSR